MADTDVQSESRLSDKVVMEQSLSSIFDKCLELHYVVEEKDSTSETYKADVEWAVSSLEEATTRVNMLNLFSRNESVDEVATADMKYLLLPALLGSFTLKKKNSSPEERSQILSLSEHYFTDYLERFRDYEVSKVNCLAEDNIAPLDDSVTLPKKLEVMAKQRENKIARFKTLKALSEKEKELHLAMKTNKDDELVRDYFLVLLKKWALIAAEELGNIKMEKEVLHHFSQSISMSDNSAKPQERPKPLKPVVISRNEMQKKVYGLGYPSIPVMTVDEFYQQRYPENVEHGPPSATEMNNLMYIAENPESHKEELEQEEEWKEKKIETDDPDYMQHTRAFDDWKDVHRRGCGNRKNKG